MNFRFLHITDYKRIIVYVWIILSILLCMQIFQHSVSKEALLLAMAYLIPVVTLTNILSNIILPREIKRQKMYAFYLQFTILTLIEAFMVAYIFFIFRYLGDIGYFRDPNLFDQSDTFSSDFINQILGISIINLAFCGIRFYYEHAKLVRINFDYKMQTLRNQITPHFMFNVLNHIHFYIENDHKLASSLLLKYSEILRYQLYQGNNKHVKLEEEIQFLKDFIDIEMIRWQDKLTVNTIWTVENTQREIPPLLFIPFIENAFKHVSRQKPTKGFIDITFKQEGNLIFLEIKNSIVVNHSITKSQNSGLGLDNVKQRLDILFNSNYQLNISSDDSTYVTQLTILLYDK